MRLGERVLLIARTKGVSQIELADKLGLTPSAVSLWAKEGRNPPSKWLPDIANILGVTQEFLLTGDDQQFDIFTQHKIEQLQRQSKYGDPTKVTNDTLKKVMYLIEEREKGSIVRFVEKIGITEGIYRGWVNKDVSPKSKTLQKISDAYDVTTEWLTTPGFAQGPKASTEKRLMDAYRRLNSSGQSEAVKRVEEMAELPRYIETDVDDEDIFR